MKKSNVYRVAIAAVISNEGLDMEDKIPVLQVLFDDLYTAEIIERSSAEVTEE